LPRTLWVQFIKVRHGLPKGIRKKRSVEKKYLRDGGRWMHGASQWTAINLNKSRTTKRTRTSNPMQASQNKQPASGPGKACECGGKSPKTQSSPVESFPREKRTMCRRNILNLIIESRATAAIMWFVGRQMYLPYETALREDIAVSEW